MTVPGARRLVLVVDADPAFAEDTRLLLQGERVLTARSIEEAGEIVAGGRVDAVILGPSFGSESAVVGAGSLRAGDPEVMVVLAANIVTNRILLGAMRSGVTDVLDTPLTLRKLAEVLARVGGPKAPRSPGTPAPAPAEAPTPEGAPNVPDPGIVTISFEAESGASTTSWFTADAASPPVLDLPPSGPIDEPAVATAGPQPDSWAVPVPAVAEPPADRPAIEEHPQPVQPAPMPPVTPPIDHGVAHPAEYTGIAPVPGMEEPSGWSEDPEPAPPTREPMTSPQPLEPPRLPDPPAADPRRVADAVVYPPPPASPPPQGMTQVVRPLDRPVATGPVDLEGMGLLPADGYRRQPRPGSGKVVAIMAGKGGSGKTITATNLGLALTFHAGEDTVVLVDADIQFGDVALLLQLEPSHTLGDAVDRLDELSDARLDGMLLRHESGLRVIPAPLLPTPAERIPAKGIVEVIERLRGMYQYVVVDTPPIFDDHLVTILECADEVLTIVDMDLPSVKNAKIALDALRSSRFPMDRVRLVVNRVNAKARLDLVELERSLGLRVAGSIPSDRLVPQSVNEGIPVVALSPRSRVARAFHTLAQMLTADHRETRRR